MYQQPFTGSYGTQSQPSQYQSLPTSPFIGSQQFGFSSQPTTSFQQQQYGTAVNPNSYHTANYHGNQLGHDAYKRSDSFTPSQQFTGNFTGGYGTSLGTTGIGTSSFGSSIGSTGMNTSSFTPQYGTNINTSINSGYTTQQYGAPVDPNSYHTANYHGNIQGHDAYKRSDSFTPNQQMMGMGSFGGSYGGSQIGAGSIGTSNFGAGYSTSIPSQFGTGMQSTFGNTGSFGNGSFASQQYGAPVNPNAYHTANYHGNIQGHDAYKRSDSFTPNQSLTGSGMGFTNNTGINSIPAYAQQSQLNSSFARTSAF